MTKGEGVEEMKGEWKEFEDIIEIASEVDGTRKTGNKETLKENEYWIEQIRKTVNRNDVSSGTRIIEESMMWQMEEKREVKCMVL